MRYLSSSVETILLSRLSRVDVDYFYKTIKYSKFHGTQKRESCVTAIFRTAAKYYKLMFLMKLHYSIFKVLLNAVFHIQCPASQPLQSTSVQEKHRSTNNVIIYSLLLLNVADV